MRRNFARWALRFLGLALALGGGAAMLRGWDIVQVERGWSQFIAGAVALSGGAVVLALAEVVAKLDRLLAGGVDVKPTPVAQAPVQAAPPAPKAAVAPPPPKKAAAEPPPPPGAKDRAAHGSQSPAGAGARAHHGAAGGEALCKRAASAAAGASARSPWGSARTPRARRSVFAAAVSAGGRRAP